MGTLYAGFYKSGAGVGGRISKSINNGVTFTSVVTELPSYWPRAFILYPSDNIIISLGSGGAAQGVVYRSVNGGDSFDLIYNVATAQIEDAQKSRDTADIIFGCGRFGYFWKSTDKGATFSYNQIEGYTAVWFRSVSFVDDDVGFVAGDDYILKTTDGGDSWTEKYSSEGAKLRGVFAVDANTIWALPEEPSDHILKSTNGGDDWDTITTTKTGDGKRIAGLVGDTDRIWFVSYAGAGMELTYTTNGGANWSTVIISSSDSIIYSRRAPFFFVTPNVGYAFNQYCQKTNDGGQTWSQLAYLSANYMMGAAHDMDFATEFRSFDITGNEPADRTSDGVEIASFNPLNFGSMGPGQDSVVKCLIFRAKNLGVYATLSEMKFYLQAKALVGTNDYYCDITDTWTKDKTPTQVEAGDPGTCPQVLPESPNLTKIGSGDITGVGHADTSQYIYLCQYIADDEVSGADITMNYRNEFDYA